MCLSISLPSYGPIPIIMIHLQVLHNHNRIQERASRRDLLTLLFLKRFFLLSSSLFRRAKSFFFLFVVLKFGEHTWSYSIPLSLFSPYHTYILCRRRYKFSAAHLLAISHIMYKSLDGPKTNKTWEKIWKFTTHIASASRWPKPASH
jgi:hypothetical protein